MFSIKRLVVMLSVVCGVVCAFGPTKGKDVHEVGHYCNPNLNSKNSQEENDIDDLIKSVITQVWNDPNNRINNLNGYYGSAACSGSLPRDDCKDCLDTAMDLLYNACGYADGAQVKLVDCRLRFEHYKFSPDW